MAYIEYYSRKPITPFPIAQIIGRKDNPVIVIDALVDNLDVKTRIKRYNTLNCFYLKHSELLLHT